MKLLILNNFIQGQVCLVSLALVLFATANQQPIQAAKILNNSLHSNLDCSGDPVQSEIYLAERCVRTGDFSSVFLNCTATGTQESQFNNENCEGEPVTRNNVPECRVVGEKYSTKNQCWAVPDDKVVRLLAGVSCTEDGGLKPPTNEVAGLKDTCKTCFYDKHCILSSKANDTSSFTVRIFEHADSTCQGNPSTTVSFENGTCKSFKVPGEEITRAIQIKPLEAVSRSTGNSSDSGSGFYDLTLSIIIRLKARLRGHF